MLLHRFQAPVLFISLFGDFSLPHYVWLSIIFSLRLLPSLFPFYFSCYYDIFKPSLCHDISKLIRQLVNGGTEVEQQWKWIETILKGQSKFSGYVMTSRSKNYRTWQSLENSGEKKNTEGEWDKNVHLTSCASGQEKKNKSTYYKYQVLQNDVWLPVPLDTASINYSFVLFCLLSHISFSVNTLWQSSVICFI